MNVAETKEIKNLTEEKFESQHVYYSIIMQVNHTPAQWKNKHVRKTAKKSIFK